MMVGSGSLWSALFIVIVTGPISSVWSMLARTASLCKESSSTRSPLITPPKAAMQPEPATARGGR
eukprot:scaffold32797_cov36-Phaeocystis_antarctica.AAC.1